MTGSTQCGSDPGTIRFWRGTNSILEPGSASSLYSADTICLQAFVARIVYLLTDNNKILHQLLEYTTTKKPRFLFYYYYQSTNTTRTTRRAPVWQKRGDTLPQALRYKLELKGENEMKSSKKLLERN